MVTPWSASPWGMASSLDPALADLESAPERAVTSQTERVAAGGRWWQAGRTVASDAALGTLTTNGCLSVWWMGSPAGEASDCRVAETRVDQSGS